MNALQFFADKHCAETVDPLDVGHRPPGTDLFNLQTGFVDIGNGKDVWYGSLQNVQDGQKHYFKSWSELVVHLQEILSLLAKSGLGSQGLKG